MRCRVSGSCSTSDARCIRPWASRSRALLHQRCRCRCKGVGERGRGRGRGTRWECGSVKVWCSWVLAPASTSMSASTIMAPPRCPCLDGIDINQCIDPGTGVPRLALMPKPPTTYVLPLLHSLSLQPSPHPSSFPFPFSFSLLPCPMPHPNPRLKTESTFRSCARALVRACVLAGSATCSAAGGGVYGGGIAVAGDQVAGSIGT